LAGCLSADSSPDGSAGVPDLAAHVYDLAGVDLTGLYNCAALNACESKCKTKACVYTCRNMATPVAVDKQIALQNCFTQFCPTGPGQVCEPDGSGNYSATCMKCIANTKIPDGMTCTQTQSTSECSMCVAQANACAND
jgi:hypothetical protein